jgi:hypothetical protein
MSNWLTITAFASEQYATYSVYRRVPPCSIAAFADIGRLPNAARQDHTNAMTDSLGIIEATMS